MPAKILAWILISVAAFGIFGSSVAAYQMLENGFYEQTEEETREALFSRYSDRYSAMVLGGYRTEYFSDKNFKFGLIEADSLEELQKLNLNSDDTYIERNFNTTVKLEDLHIFQCSIKEDTWFSYRARESLMGWYRICNTGSDVSEGHSYYVLSFVPKELKWKGNWLAGDLFVKTDTLVRLGYEWRYDIYWILLGSIVIFLLSLIFLLCAAGHRRGREEITATWLEKIPLECNVIGCYILEAMAICLLAYLEGRNYGDFESTVLSMVGFSVVALCAGWILLEFILSFTVRVKLGKWWKNTIVWKTGSGLWKTLQKIYDNMDILQNAIAFMLLLSVLEFGIIFMMRNRMGMGLILWFLEKAILILLLSAVVIQMRKLMEAGEHIAKGDMQYQVDTTGMYKPFRQHGENLNSLSEGLSIAVAEKMKSEHFKTELITNVSHDIKTPLTSIINYVDLLKKEEMENETAQEYIEVLDRQSVRLKKLIEDLMEASKASTGNLPVNFEKLEAGVFMVQTVGEFEEKTEACELELVIKKPEEPVHILADGRHFWRVIDNLMNNICKYAQPQTRVYINLETRDGKAYLIFRNTSRYPLNISSEELMERFVRGDSSRNTEGSGLGLSIAKSLMELMNGTFELFVDGDLFKVVLTFDVCAGNESFTPQTDTYR